MESRESVLKSAIIHDFGSVARFAETIGLPTTSVRNSYLRGVGTVSVDTYFLICHGLGIDPEALAVNRELVYTKNGESVQSGPTLPKELSILNEKGMEKVLQYAADISANPEYTEKKEVKVG